MASSRFLTWKPERPLDETEKTSLTVVSGFLGSGKTTVLKHLLSQANGRRLALVVNDVGEVNIDADLVRGSILQTDQPVTGLMELSSGCICCSMNTDLADALLHLVETQHPDHIVVEASGVAEPKHILQSLYTDNLRGHTAADFLRIHNMITVVDAPVYRAVWGQAFRKQRRRAHLRHGDPRRPLVELAAEQVEYADLLIINKMDAIDQAELPGIKQELRLLNERAEIVPASHGRVPIDQILDVARFSEDGTPRSPRWKQVLLADSSFSVNAHDPHHHPPSNDHPDHEHDPHHVHHYHADYGLDSFVFTARRPFRRADFLRVVRREMDGVIRAKGFYWTLEDYDDAGVLSLAGNVVRADRVGKWFVTMLKEGGVTVDAMPEFVKRVWNPDTGDRRQELVFIGVDLDKARLHQRLTACLTASQ